MKYRKKPVVIEAVQYLGDENKFEIAEFFKGHGSFDLKFTDYGLLIHTLEGDMRVSPNDFIIRGVQGEFYPCKPDIFEATYDKVQDPS